MTIGNLEALVSIYNEMRGRNKQKILTEGLFIDPVIASSSIDRRQGVAVVYVSEFELNPQWHNMMRDAETMFKNQTLYYPLSTSSLSSGILHHTFFQFVKVEDIPSEGINDNTLKQYKDILQSVLSEIKPYTITYRGIIAIPSGLLMCGYPDEDINRYRDKIRDNILQSGIYFREPYKADTFHSTLVRLNTAEAPQNLLDFADKYSNTSFGTLHVRELALMYGSWRMRPDEVSLIHLYPLK